MKKNIILFLLLLFYTSSFSQNKSEPIDDAYEFYETGKFEQSIQLCERILSSTSEDLDSLSNKATASYTLHLIYLTPKFKGFDIHKSYEKLIDSQSIYTKITNKYPEKKKYYERLIAEINDKITKMPTEFPGCNTPSTESTIVKTEKKDTGIDHSNEVQNNERTVTINVSGSGKTQDEAKQSALRSAIEQAFGTFISAKTEILNDSLVSDQISSVTSGNIKSFDILNASQFPDGTWGVTLKAIVSIDKLTSFVEAKGVTVEIKGGLFAQSIKQQLLNEQGEVNAINQMIGLLHEPMQISFDYVIKSSDPKSVDSESKNWEIPLLVTATCNKNIDFCANYFRKTLAALSLSSTEVETYKSLNKHVFSVEVNYNQQEVIYYLRKQSSIDAINSLISNWEFYTRLFVVQSGMDESYGNGKGEIFDISKRKVKYYNNGDDPTTVNFPTEGELAGEFSWSDKRTLSQIEQMTGYSVKPRGVVSNFKNGGYVVYENDGQGIVMALYDQGSYNWADAKIVCDELVLNGYKDWRLPEINDLEMINIYLYKSQIKCGIEFYSYWSNIEYSDTNAGYFSFENGKASYFNDKSYSSNKNVIKKVRAVREFGSKSIPTHSVKVQNSKNENSINSNQQSKKDLIIIVNGKKKQIYDYDFDRPMNWYNAIKACKSIGNGWRLPNNEELKEMYFQLYRKNIGNFYDQDKRTKIGNPNEFRPSEYWSSEDNSLPTSNYRDDFNEAYYFCFGDGYLRNTADANGRDKNDEYNVRAIRDIE